MKNENLLVVLEAHEGKPVLIALWTWDVNVDYFTEDCEKVAQLFLRDADWQIVQINRILLSHFIFRSSFLCNSYEI